MFVQEISVEYGESAFNHGTQKIFPFYHEYDAYDSGQSPETSKNFGLRPIPKLPVAPFNDFDAIPISEDDENISYFN